MRTDENEVNNLTRTNSRRQFVITLLSTSLFAACTPLKLILNQSGSSKSFEKIIEGFIDVIIPGIDIQSLDLKTFFDPNYPLFPYTKILADDLVNTSEKMYATKHFEKLSRVKREKLILKRSSNILVQKLYFGAIWFTQVVIYTGITNPDQQCALIEFEGAFKEQNTTYEFPEKFLGQAITKNGNLI